MKFRLTTCACALLATLGLVTSGGLAATAGASTAAAKKPTGAPVVMFAIGDGSINLDQYAGGIKAAIGAINRAGGIKGRPASLVTCDDGGDSNQAGVCAQKLADNPNAYASVSSSSGYDSQILPVFQQNSVAGIGTMLVTPADLGSPMVFATNGGGFSALLATAMLGVDQLHIKNLGMVVLDIPASKTAASVVEGQVVKPAGATSVTAAIPATAADLSAQAAALSGTDGVLLITPDPQASLMVKALRQQGYTKPILSAAAGFASEKAMKSSLGDVKNFYLTTFYDHRSAGYKNFLAEMKKYNPSGTINDLAASAWLAAHLYADTANKLSGSLSRESVLAAMNATTAYGTKGMLAEPINYTTPGTALGGAGSRIVPAVAPQWPVIYKNGLLVSKKDAQSINPFPPPAK